MALYRGLYNGLAGSLILNGLIGLWIFSFRGLHDWVHRTHANVYCWALIIIGIVMIFIAIMVADFRRKFPPRPSD